MYRASMLKSSLAAFNSSKLFSSKRKNSTFWSWATQPRGNWKESLQEAAVAICVFGVTGTASVSLVRPALKNIGLEGSMIDGPNSYRIFSVIIVSPIYACLLLISGTLAGRHPFFAKMSFKILARFLPKAFLKRVMCTPARSK